MKRIFFAALISIITFNAQAFILLEDTSYFDQLKVHFDQAPRSAVGADFPNVNTHIDIACRYVDATSDFLIDSSVIYATPIDNGPLFPVSYKFTDVGLNQQLYSFDSGTNILSLGRNGSNYSYRGQFKTDGTYLFIWWKHKATNDSNWREAMEYCWKK